MGTESSSEENKADESKQIENPLQTDENPQCTYERPSSTENISPPVEMSVQNRSTVDFQDNSSPLSENQSASGTPKTARKKRRKSRYPKTIVRIKRQKRKPITDNKFTHDRDGKFKIYPMKGDGNCLFRTMAYYVFGAQAEHDFVRHMVVGHVNRNWDLYQNFAHEDGRHNYVQRMYENGTYGAEMEIVAFVDVFGCRVRVYFENSPERNPVTYGSGNVVLYMIYSGEIDCGHYNVLLPMSTPGIDIDSHKDSVNRMRQMNLEEYGVVLRHFKSIKC